MVFNGEGITINDASGANSTTYVGSNMTLAGSAYRLKGWGAAR